MSAAPEKNRLISLLWIFLGWICFTVGFIGVILPGIPTTGPMILALACFSKGSERLLHWLHTHPVFGPPLRRWHQEGTIPFHAKCLAVGMMVLSATIILFFSPLAAWIKALCVILVLVGLFVVLRIPHTKWSERGSIPQE